MRTISWLARCLLVCRVAVGILGGAATPPPEPAEPEPAAPAATEQTYQALDSFLREQIEDIGSPGAAVAVVHNGAPVHTAAFGRADQSGRPMTIQTPVLLASTSKSLTAIAVMQQVEAGRLRLDEPVQTYLPWFTMESNKSSAITVRHLLHQSSGMASKDTAFEASDAQDPAALEQGVRDLSDAALAGVPGRAFHYASANFNILGMLVQTVSGQPFGEYLEQHVFGPLDMTHSHPTRAEARSDNAAAGHALWFGRFWRQTDVPAPTTGMPSSTLYSSAEDLGHELIAMLDGGTYRGVRILQPESVSAMLEPAVQVEGSKWYAMGWFTRPLVESTSAEGPSVPEEELPLLVEHQGEWGNSHTYLAMVPDSGLGLALVINGNDTAAPSRLKAIDTNLLRILHGQSPIDPVIHEDWLQRNSWAVALALLVAELLSLGLVLRFLLQRQPGPRKRRAPLVWAAVALALDGFALWLCFIYAPVQFDTHLLVIVRQFPDVGISLVPVLMLAILWPIPRTVWLLSRHRIR
ncbi:serine hydrolase domain-containing protein [Pseudarthrobacter sp. J75]|uniref:serine hydrolase domain-containing protein n=1 Tax=unclassified Pseudarthrobacter TaxID=2647000 RepID=UPI002E811AA5|nr:MULTISPECIES: serine hydrolase domain-containing protein [unclassified Pseudarthrobacter]MEE2524635.1 serine hydrolase domain-containing protein [Pseudarthrobacter sp. J47]MEE2527578.1 serine hydrolase domain-containing protein [Pseudarthrobacter sp. J75]